MESYSQFERLSLMVRKSTMQNTEFSDSVRIRMISHLSENGINQTVFFIVQMRQIKKSTLRDYFPLRKGTVLLMMQFHMLHKKRVEYHSEDSSSYK